MDSFSQEEPCCVDPSVACAAGLLDHTAAPARIQGSSCENLASRSREVCHQTPENGNAVHTPALVLVVRSQTLEDAGNVDRVHQYEGESHVCRENPSGDA